MNRTDRMLGIVLELQNHGRCRAEDLAATFEVSKRTNGSGTLMRIYRDTRFCQDKTPYKTAVSGLFWQGDGKKTASPAFGFHVDGEGMHLDHFHIMAPIQQWLAQVLA